MTRTSCFSFALAVSLVALLFLTTDDVQAQRSNTRGLFLNAHLNATTIGYDQDDFDTQTGGGLGVQFGYGVSNLVALFLGVDGSVMSNEDVEDAFTLAHVDVGAQFNFGKPRSAARPYGVIALTFRQATFDLGEGNRAFEVDFSGGGLTLGGGLKYFFSRAVALDVGLNLTFGEFTDVEVGGVTVQDALDLNATSGRFVVGLSWFPSRR